MRRRRSRRRRPRTDADVADTRRPDLRDLRAHPAGGRARAALRAARGRRARRRLPAVRRRGDRAGMAEGGVADDPDRPRRAPEAKALAVGDLRPPTHAARGRDGRTVAGIAKSLGPPKASIVPLSGVNTEAVITVAWDISWYQYRVTVDSAQPVRLEERGLELREVDRGFQAWNAELDRHGRLMPAIARV